MLTISQILKSARLMSQVGENRPGFIDNDATFLKGPEVLYGQQSNLVVSEEGINYNEELVQDSETGEFRFVAKV